MISETLCAWSAIAALFSSCAAGGAVVGYVEGEYVNLAPVDTAQVISVAVRRGQRVTRGQTLAIMETADAELDLADAEAALAQRRSELADLKSGKRAEEIAVIEADIASAVAQAEQARKTLARRLDLFRRGVVPRAELDNAQASADVAEAKLRELEANLKVARLPARVDVIAAAEDAVRMAEARRGRARWHLDQRRLVASADGRISDIIRRPGETAGPALPVLAMLPDGAVKLKLYVPEPLVSRVSVGTALDVSCDGCPAGLAASVSYVSPDPEFTPPVIYSLDVRQKLVYLVEARPEGNASSLQPGQIVDVGILEAEE